MQSSTVDELPPLTNQDVEILYEIVTTATTLDGPPFRALFEAYDNILESKCIDKDHDQIYFRFLLHMGEDHTHDRDGMAGLYPRFSDLLGRLGIQIEVVEGGEGVEEVTRHFDDLDTHGEGQGLSQTTPSSLQKPPRKSPRRASFSSVQEKTLEPTWRNILERNDAGPSGAFGLPPRSSSQTSDPSYRRTRSRDARPAYHSGLPHRGRLNSRTRLEQLHSQTRVRPRSVSSNGSIKITGALDNNERRMPYRSSKEDQSSFGSGKSRHSSLPDSDIEPEHYVPPEMLYRPSDTQMISDAEVFLESRTRLRARRALHQWHDQALTLSQHHAQMEEAASALDRRKLIDAALEMMNVKLNEQRQAKETERFFEHLERRADKARDLFLQTKAFTHWANCASDEKIRTSVARRHILRFKYFNAWQEVTAVQELKVRQFCLRKFLGVWRQRTSKVQNSQNLALSFRSESIIKHAYQSSYWEFMERRATKFNAERLKRKHVPIMAGALLKRFDQDAWAEEHREYHLQRKNFDTLLTRTRAARSHDTVADDFRRRNLLLKGLTSINRAVRLRYPFLRVAQNVDFHLLQRVIAVWRQRTEQTRRATRIDQQRILRNAFTAWNDKLRIEALAQRIDDRILTQTLYKWSIASRAALLTRLRNADKKRELFHTWASKAREQHAQKTNAEQRFYAAQESRLKRTMLERLRVTVQNHNQLQEVALSIYEPRLVERTLHKWIERHKSVARLETWGTNAEFYTICTHTLRKWRESTQRQQRIRKREAYATVRRSVKMSLARRAFNTWRNKAVTYEVMGRQAQELRENLILSTTTDALQHWQESARRIAERTRQAEEFRRRNLLSRTLCLWSGQSKKTLRDGERARALLAEHTAAEASVCFKRLNWRLFQVQRQQESGVALAGRNFEKHVKSMLRHWADQASALRANRPRAPTEVADNEQDHFGHDGTEEHTENTNTDAEQDEHDRAIARASEWTALDDSAFDLGNLDLNFNPLFQRQDLNRTQNRANAYEARRNDAPNPFSLTINPANAASLLTSTPLPGYMRTPSKRNTARTKTRDRLAALSSSAAPPSSSAFRPSALSASTFVLPTTTGSTTPAAAPPTTLNMPATIGPSTTYFPATAPPQRDISGVVTPGNAITPFDRKLRAQGYSERRGGTERRPRGGRRGFSGFEDILEDEDSAKRRGR